MFFHEKKFNQFSLCRPYIYMCKIYSSIVLILFFVFMHNIIFEENYLFSFFLFIFGIMV